MKMKMKRRMEGRWEILESFGRDGGDGDGRRGGKKKSEKLRRWRWRW